MRRRVVSLFLVVCALVGCGGGGTPTDTGGSDTGSPADTGAAHETGTDATTVTDTGPGTDSAMGIDTALADVPPTLDTAVSDVRPMDSGRDVLTDTSARDVPLMPTPGVVACFGIICMGGTPVCCDVVVDGGFAPVCGATAASCAPGPIYACDDGSDCTGTQVCCGDIVTNDAGRPRLTGSSCAASCTAPNLQLCAASGQCGSGRTCVPERLTGRDIGVCR